MLRILLEFGDELMGMTEMAGKQVTVGRSPENDLQIDNLSVSNFHARILESDGRYYVEDAGSTNGTFVHEKKIDRRWPLNEGDVVMIGKHTLRFEFGGEASADVRSDPVLRRQANLDKTMILKTRKQEERNMRERSSHVPPEDDFGPVGVLQVTAGSLPKSRYELTDNMSLIGTDPGADIRLKGFFTPAIAGFVHRDEKGYSLIPPQKKNKIKLNGRSLQKGTALKTGDRVAVGAYIFTFQLPD